MVLTVRGSASEYDAIHRAVVDRTGGEVDGLVLHVARLVEDGYQVIEVWDSKEACDEANRTVVWPAVRSVVGDGRPAAEPQVEEFDVRGLIIPAARTTA